VEVHRVYHFQEEDRKMDIGRSFTYITQDQDWVKKVLLGGVIMLIPVVGPLFALGFMLETMRNIIAGREVPLPEIGDFGGKLVEGLKIWVISFVYSLPVILFAICAQAGNLTPILAENADRDTVEVLTTISIGVSACCGCLMLLYSILAGLILPFAWGKYAETGEFGAAFQLSELFEMLKDNIGPAFIVLLVGGLAALVAEIVGLIACGIGLLFTLFYAQLIMAFLYGSLYRQAKPVAL
jgi:hypothetical protein